MQCQEQAGRNWKKRSCFAALAGAVAASVCAAPVSAAEVQDATDLGETVVTAERIPSKRMDTPANMAVVTAKEIAANHYATVAEAIENINGVVIRHMGGGKQDYVYLNGDERVVLLVDGVRMNDAMGASAGRASVDLNMLPSVKNIQRIEVVKGGASALYGSDAVGGVINIITKKGIQNETRIDLNTGSWRTHNMEVTNQGSDGTLSWFVTGSLSRQGYLNSSLGDLTIENSDSTGNGFAARLDGRFDDRSSLGFSFAHRSLDAGAYNISGTSFDNVSSRANGRLREVFNDYALTYRFKEGTATPGFLRVFHNGKTIDNQGNFDTTYYGADYQNGWTLGGAHRLIAGLSYHRGVGTNISGGGYDGEGVTNTALYVQDTWELGGNVTLIPGIRMDHHSKFGTHVTPKIALNYRPAEDTQVYASWGRVFKAPTLDDLYYNNVAWGMYGNPNLDPETGWTATIGVRQKVGRHAEVDLSYFQSEMKDKISWVFDRATYQSFVAANEDERKRGLELSYRQTLSPAWSYELGYSYVYTEKDARDGNGYTWDNGNLQPNGYRIGVHYAKGPWKANLFGRYATGLDTGVYHNSSAGIWDLNVSYDILPNWTTYLRINNLTDAEYYVYKNSYGYYPGTGRFIQIGMNYAF